MRKAAKVLESTWKLSPHPELAQTYIHLRSGDSALDRLKRAESLAGLRSNHAEGQFAVAQAALDAGEFKKARDAMQAVLRNKATERACLLMADIEEAEHGDRGRVREWLSRAVTAPRDAAWTADGIVAEHWAPVSPITGEIGAFEWKVPVEALEGPAKTVDYSELAHEEPKPEPKVVMDGTEDVAEAVVIATTAAAAAKEIASEKLEENEAADRAHVQEKITTPPGSVARDQQTGAATDSEKSPPVAANDEPRQGKQDATKEPPAKQTAEADKMTPYKNSNLDPDDDGIIDHRPDDPGINDEPKKKKAVFF